MYINVTNRGEDAYEATLLVSFPPNVDYIKTELLKTATVIPSKVTGDDIQDSMMDTTSSTYPASYLARPTSVLCSAPTPHNGHILICDLGNPLIEQSMVRLFLFLLILKTSPNRFGLLSQTPFHIDFVNFRYL